MNTLMKDIAGRRAIYPDRFNDGEIKPEDVRQLLKAARYAPTHKLTEPWRFHVLMGEPKDQTALKMKEYIEHHTTTPRKGIGW